MNYSTRSFYLFRVLLAIVAFGKHIQIIELQILLLVVHAKLECIGSIGENRLKYAEASPMR